MIFLQVKALSESVYSVYEVNRRYMMDFESKTCNYGMFQFDKISRSHKIVVFKSKHVKYMGPYYFNYNKPATLVKTYEVKINPMSDMKD